MADMAAVRGQAVTDGEDDCRVYMSIIIREKRETVETMRVKRASLYKKRYGQNRRPTRRSKYALE